MYLPPPWGFDEIKAKLIEYHDAMAEHIVLRAVPPLERAADVSERMAQFHNWLVANQDHIGGIVERVLPGKRFPLMIGTSNPSSTPTTQKQLISMALVNLENDPSLADQFLATKQDGAEADKLAETADHLKRMADEMPQQDWEAHALLTQQLVRHVNPEAALQIGNMADLPWSQINPDDRDKLINIIRGVAIGLRIHGVTDPAETPKTVVNVETKAQQSQGQAQFQSQSIAVTIEELLEWDDLPDEARPILVDIQEAKEKGDKDGILKRYSDVAGLLSKFPDLANKVGNAAEFFTDLLG